MTDQTKTFSAALELRFDHPEIGDDITVRTYLFNLLKDLWEQQGEFDAKSHFGDTSWEHDIYRPLAKAGFIDMGPFDDTGEPYMWTVDQINKAHAYVHDLILCAFFEEPKP